MNGNGRREFQIYVGFRTRITYEIVCSWKRGKGQMDGGEHV